MANKEAEAEAWRDWREYNAPHIEYLKGRALEPDLPWVVQVLRTWQANRAIKERNRETFSKIAEVVVHLMERDRQDGKRLVISRAIGNGSRRVVYEPLLPYPPRRRHKK